MGWFTNGCFHHTVTFAYLAWSNLHHRKGNFRLHSIFFAIEKEVFSYIVFSWYKCHWILSWLLFWNLTLSEFIPQFIHSKFTFPWEVWTHFWYKCHVTEYLQIHKFYLNFHSLKPRLTRSGFNPQPSHSKRIDQVYSSLRG